MLILLLFGVLCAWYLQKEIYRKYWARGLSASVRFTEPYTYEGETSFFLEEISNHKFLPLPTLEVRIVTSRNLEFGGEAKENASISDQSYLRDVFAFLGYQKVIRRLPFVCRKRGLYDVRSAELIGYDLLYSNKYYMEQKQQTQLYVYPRQVDIRRIRLICQSISGMVIAQQKLFPDPFEFSGIREYQVTDPMHRINWKASARSNELMVNQYDSTTNMQVTLVLDVEDSGIMKYQELTEESIRILSSLAAELTAKGAELEVRSNACVRKTSGNPENDPSFEVLSMHLKSGTGQIQEFNQKLACIEEQQIVSPAAQILLEDSLLQDAGKIVVLLSKNKTEENEEALQMLARRGSQVLWVIPVHPYMEQETAKRGVTELYWEVG